MHLDPDRNLSVFEPGEVVYDSIAAHLREIDPLHVSNIHGMAVIVVGTANDGDRTLGLLTNSNVSANEALAMVGEFVLDFIARYPAIMYRIVLPERDVTPDGE